MTIQAWLRTVTTKLTEAGINTARLDCLVLLQDCLDKDKSWILAHQDKTLHENTLKQLNEQVGRRAKHEPLAYIRGKSEFYGREFTVSADTLQPRPETETMVELLLKQVESRKLNVDSIVDIGTGSGCIATTLALELPHVTVVGTDISKECVRIARQNAKGLKAGVKFYQGNLLRPVPETVFNKLYILVANLPYVPDAFTVNQAAMHEPKLAIFGGSDGLDYYRQLFGSLPVHKPVQIYTESLPTQHAELQAVAKSYGYKEVAREDFIQLFELI